MNLRRSERVRLEVPVDLAAANEPSTPGTAVVVSRHGALVLSPIRCTDDEILTMVNRHSGETTTCRVVYVGAPDGGQGQRLGIEFTGDAPGFWGPEYEMLVAAHATEATGPGPEGSV
jgi:hypothetical protein